MSIVARWGLSSLDWHAHAIDEDADHPCGVYLARCGHRPRKANTFARPIPCTTTCPAGSAHPVPAGPPRGTPPRGAA
ncbi:MAG TPA: hypothetical protein VN327_05245 [Pseudonocardiaceae bacterium]|nr:hypothetical protein [Pseudonocardiaceae bacterium]